MNEAPPLRVTGLRTAFGKSVIHDGLDFEMRRGEILGIVGGSGTGKSVLPLSETTMISAEIAAATASPQDCACQNSEKSMTELTVCSWSFIRGSELNKGSKLAIFA